MPRALVPDDGSIRAGVWQGFVKNRNVNKIFYNCIDIVGEMA